MKTAEVIKKIEDHGYYTADTYSILIYRARIKGNQNIVDEYKHKLRGYLTALKDTGFLTENEMKLAYLWYFSKEHKEHDK